MPKVIETTPPQQIEETMELLFEIVRLPFDRRRFREFLASYYEEGTETLNEFGLPTLPLRVSNLFALILFLLVFGTSAARDTFHLDNFAPPDPPLSLLLQGQCAHNPMAYGREVLENRMTGARGEGNLFPSHPEAAALIQDTLRYLEVFVLALEDNPQLDVNLSDWGLVGSPLYNAAPLDFEQRTLTSLLRQMIDEINDGSLNILEGEFNLGGAYTLSIDYERNWTNIDPNTNTLQPTDTIYISPSTFGYDGSFQNYPDGATCDLLSTADLLFMVIHEYGHVLQARWMVNEFNRINNTGLLRELLTHQRSLTLEAGEELGWIYSVLFDQPTGDYADEGSLAIWDESGRLSLENLHRFNNHRADQDNDAWLVELFFLFKQIRLTSRTPAEYVDAQHLLVEDGANALTFLAYRAILMLNSQSPDLTGGWFGGDANMSGHGWYQRILNFQMQNPEITAADFRLFVAFFEWDARHQGN